MTNYKLPKFFIPVKGGLGNQMFFYAFSFYLKNNGFKTHLIWNEFVFTKQHNGVELFEVFNIPVNVITKNKINFLVKLNKSQIPFIFKRVLGRVFKGKYILMQKHKQASPYTFENFTEYKNVKKIYADGFWQNYKYLESIRGELLESYRFKLPANFSNEDYLKKIKNSNSVSIHIRRGDYLDPKFADLNVIRSKDYYLRALEFIKDKVENPIFFIFTDDLAWAKKEFDSENFVFIEGNENKKAYLDMYLMSECKHNIIANSTFSWWGAWLNTNPFKIVIVPDFWTLQTLSSELCPPEWILLKTN